MASRLVTAATFPSVALAMLARNLLADAGIASEITEGNTSWAFSGLLGEVKLIVAEEDLTRAEEVLDERVRLFATDGDECDAGSAEQDDDANTPAEEDTLRPIDYSPALDAPAWTCPSCGVRVADDVRRCWSCGTTKRGEANPYFAGSVHKAADPPRPKQSEVPADVVDDLVTRAWRASMIGILLFPPLVTFYSMWLLVRAATTGATFDPRQNRRFMIALLVNVIVGGVAIAIWWEFVGVPVFFE